MGSITILLLLIWLFQLLALAGNLRAWRQYRREVRLAPQRRPVEAGEQAAPLPERAQPLVEALEALGFEQIGAADAGDPGGRETLPVWVFTAPGSAAIAELARARTRLVLIFTTLFGERAAVETAYPGGQRIDEPDFQVRAVRTGVEAAYEQHREQAAAFAASYGEPTRVASMADFLAASAMYNERFLPRKLAAARPRVLAPVLASAYGSLVLAGGLLVHLILAPPPFTLAAALVVLLIPAMLSEVGVWVWLGRRLSG